MRFLGVPLSHSRSTSLTSNIVTSRYIPWPPAPAPSQGPKREACTRGQAGGKGFEKLQSRGGKGFEKLSRKGSLGFEHRHRLDFIVERCLVVELKAAAKISEHNFAQTRAYLQTTNLDAAVVINFPSPENEDGPEIQFVAPRAQ